MPFERETERLRLRRPVPADLPDFTALPPRTYARAGERAGQGRAGSA